LCELDYLSSDKRLKWHAVMNMVMNLGVPKTAEKFLTNLASVSSEKGHCCMAVCGSIQLHYETYSKSVSNFVDRWTNTVFILFVHFTHFL
jgi:hypothetical protein